MYTKESITLSDKRFDEIVSSVSKSYPNSCVLWIDEIHNDTLLAKYMNREEELARKYGEKLKKLELFHGTRNECIDLIANEGFKSELNVTSAYGKGTYFATNALYSSNYMKTDGDAITYMFLCDVLVGEKICSRVNDIPKGVVRVDNKSNTKIYVVPDDDSIYPRYIIAFYKNAK